MAINKIPELLCPAGDLTRLCAAVDYGADAVYLAGEEFGMRTAATNFGEEDLKKGIEYAHKHGVKVHIACNIIPHNEEIARLPDFLKTVNALGADALIAADIGTIGLIKKYAPDTELHASVQSGICNYETANAFYNMGAKRVVLARELSLAEIAEIRAKTPQDLELEAFAHGAAQEGIEEFDACEADSQLQRAQQDSHHAGDGAASGPRRRSNFSIMARLVGLTRPLLPVMALAILLGVLGFVAAIFLTVFAAYGLLDAAGVWAAIPVGAACVAVAVCGVVRGPLRYGEQLCNHYLAFKILALVRDKVFGKMRTLAPAKLEGRDKGDLVSLLTSDVELLEVFYAHTLSPAAIALIVSLGMVAFTATLSPLLALYVAFSYAVVGIAVPWVSSKASGTGGREVRDAIGSMNAFVLDSLRGLRETLQFGRAVDRAQELSNRMDSLIRVEARLKGRTAIAMAATGAAVLALDMGMLLASMHLVNYGMLDFGCAVVACAALMSSFGSVIAVANLGSTLQQTLASGARVLDVLDECPQTEEVEGGVSLEGFEGAVASHVDFSYGDAKVLSDVELHVEPGQVVQIAGRSGSGKSTLLKLFMRFWDVDRGAIEVSGRDIRCVNTASLREVEGFMTQETHLFAGTVRDNLAFAKPGARDEEIMAACEKASIAGFVRSLPEGLDTQVGELGDALSGGERQRLGLARMFLHDAPFVLLDEPTSNLDALNEAAVLRALSDNRAGKTVLLVSHRPSAAAIADVTYSVEHGRVS